MKNRNDGKAPKRGVVNVVLLLLLLFELVIFIGGAESKKSSLEFGIEYEKSPLLLKKAVVTNREDLRELFDLYENMALYEICLTYENVANYAGSFRARYNLETTDENRYVGIVNPEGSSSIGREAVYNQVVPAGKTGCFRFYAAAPADAEGIRIYEEEEKLTGSRQTAVLSLPSGMLESDTWEAAEP